MNCEDILNEPNLQMMAICGQKIRRATDSIETAITNGDAKEALTGLRLLLKEHKIDVCPCALIKLLSNLVEPDSK